VGVFGFQKFVFERGCVVVAHTVIGARGVPATLRGPSVVVARVPRWKASFEFRPPSCCRRLLSTWRRALLAPIRACCAARR
jgi:hypothetical protein